MARRSTDRGSLIAGMSFVVLGLAFVLHGSGHQTSGALWLPPFLILGAGLALVAWVLLRSKNRRG